MTENLDSDGIRSIDRIVNDPPKGKGKRVATSHNVDQLMSLVGRVKR